MARVELTRPVVNMLDTNYVIDPARDRLQFPIGPIAVDLSYAEALNHYQRLGDALMRLRPPVGTEPLEGDPTCEESPSLLPL